MSIAKFGRFLRKYVADILFLAVVVFVFFHVPTRSWLIQQVMRTGLFNASLQSSPREVGQGLAFSFMEVENGAQFSNDDLKGQVVFLHFWASWCPPCRAELPSIVRLYKEYAQHGQIRFVLINEDEVVEKAKKFLAEQQLDLPLHRSRGPMPKEYFSGSLPTTLVLDKQGRIRYKKEGFANYDSKGFKEQLEELAAAE